MPVARASQHFAKLPKGDIEQLFKHLIDARQKPSRGVDLQVERRLGARRPVAHAIMGCRGRKGKRRPGR